MYGVQRLLIYQFMHSLGIEAMTLTLQETETSIINTFPFLLL